MMRLFKQHYIRAVEELDGLWDFYPEGETTCYQMPVPGCWEQHPDFSTYRGKATYLKKIYVKESGPIQFDFKGVSHTADVYFDDLQITHHYNAFTPFCGMVPYAEKGFHELKVIVTNTFGTHSALHIPNDYYTYGGITRPVSFTRLSNIFIKNVAFTPFFQDDCWRCSFAITVQNIGSETTSFHLNMKLAGHEMVSQPQTIVANSEQTVTLEEEFWDVIPWSHENPKLYEVHTTLHDIFDSPVDDLVERVGFRTIVANGSTLLVNGEKVFLKGFNRHEDYAVVGCAIPLQLMVQDMNLMQDMGVNALRTSHYPNDERFLDLCDERGIYVWEENHARGLNLSSMQNPNFDRQCHDCIHEMITHHYNHPSIIIWGILNECASETKEGRAKYQMQYEQIKSLDQSRLTTSANCRHFSDITLDLSDISSYNIYSGWYEDDPIDERNQAEIDWIASSGGKDKPMIISEFGAAAIYGYRDRKRCKWSEERQADIISECLDVYMKNENISGVFIWQFADCRVTEEGGWFSSRARCHNNKGVVDEYRRPKMAYDIVRDFFRETL